MPDLTIEEADRCPDCDAILYGDGPCRSCGNEPEEVGACERCPNVGPIYRSRDEELCASCAALPIDDAWNV